VAATIDDSYGSPPRRPNAVTRKLEALAPLGPDDRLMLDEWERSAVMVGAGQPLAAEGAVPDSISWLFEGWAAWHKDFRDGRRQILALLLPGDSWEGDPEARVPLDHGVRTLTRARIAKIPREVVTEVLRGHPRLATALRRADLVEQSFLRAWMVNLGQRPALERMAHLICEVGHRLGQGADVTGDRRFELPLTQLELASALGLTSVHVNRVLQRLRSGGLIDFRDGIMVIHDHARLCALADFKAGPLA
jgi:CRP-like cAMP-binding protein